MAVLCVAVVAAGAASAAIAVVHVHGAECEGQLKGLLVRHCLHLTAELAHHLHGGWRWRCHHRRRRTGAACLLRIVPNDGSLHAVRRARQPVIHEQFRVSATCEANERGGLATADRAGQQAQRLGIGPLQALGLRADIATHLIRTPVMGYGTRAAMRSRVIPSGTFVSWTAAAGARGARFFTLLGFLPFVGCLPPTVCAVVASTRRCWRSSLRLAAAFGFLRRPWTLSSRTMLTASMPS